MPVLKESPLSWRPALLCIVVLALILRAGSIAVNHRNCGTYFGHSLNAADVAVTYLRTGLIGYQDTRWSSQYHNEAMAAQCLIDPEDSAALSLPFDSLEPNFEDELGLPMIMGTLWQLLPMRFVYVELLQAVLDVVCVWLLYHAAFVLLQRRDIALGSAFLYAVWPLQVYLIAYPVPYVWAVFLSVGILFVLTRFIVRSAPTRRLVVGAIVLGLLIGVMTLVRSTALLVAGATALSAVLLVGVRRGLLVGLIVVLAEGAVLTPLLIRNHRLYGEYRVTRGVFWHNLWVGFGAHENPFGLTFDDHAAARVALRDHPGVKEFGPEYERIVRELVIQGIRQHPMWFLRVQLQRVWWIIMPPTWARRVVAAPLVVGALVGIVGVWRRRTADMLPLLAAAIPTMYFFFSITAVYPPNTRFVLPAYTYLLILDAATVVLALDWIRDRRVRSGRLA